MPNLWHLKWAGAMPISFLSLFSLSLTVIANIFHPSDCDHFGGPGPKSIQVS